MHTKEEKKSWRTEKDEKMMQMKTPRVSVPQFGGWDKYPAPPASEGGYTVVFTKARADRQHQKTDLTEVKRQSLENQNLINNNKHKHKKHDHHRHHHHEDEEPVPAMVSHKHPFIFLFSYPCMQ